MGEARPRVSASEKAPEAYQAMAALERYIHGCGLEQSLIELVKLRASQINGCACSPRERAALAWAEAVTTLDGHVPDELYEETLRHFSEKELVDLNWAVVAINAWNRLAIPFRSEVGSYQSAAGAALSQAARTAEVGR